MSACTIPPDGWRCTRESGHDGPCAAVPVARTEPLSREERSDFALQANPIGWAGAVVIPRYEVTLRAAEWNIDRVETERDEAHDREQAAEERADALRAALEELTDAAGLIVNGYARKVHPGRDARDYGFIGETLHQRTMAAIASGASAIAADDAARGDQ